MPKLKKTKAKSLEDSIASLGKGIVNTTLGNALRGLIDRKEEISKNGIIKELKKMRSETAASKGTASPLYDPLKISCDTALELLGDKKALAEKARRAEKLSPEELDAL